jgi:hypothetical protein
MEGFFSIRYHTFEITRTRTSGKIETMGPQVFVRQVAWSSTITLRERPSTYDAMLLSEQRNKKKSSYSVQPGRTAMNFAKGSRRSSALKSQEFLAAPSLP